MLARTILLITFCLFFSAIASAADGPPAPAEVGREVAAQQKSKGRLDALWQKFGIKKSQEEDADDEAFYSPCADCTAAEVKLKSAQGTLTLVRVSVAGDWHRRYLVYRDTAAAPVYLGFADVFSKLISGAEHIVNIDKYEFLVLPEVTMEGTGVFAECENWYALKGEGEQKELATLLVLPVQAHASDAPDSDYLYEYRAAIKPEKLPDGLAVNLDCEIKHSMGNKLFFTQKAQARYIYTGARDEFAFDDETSDLSDDDLARLAAAGLDAEGLVQNYFDDLKKIAESGSAAEKKVLKDFLYSLPTYRAVLELDEAMKEQGGKTRRSR
jgi:hypothetical protein